MRETKQATKAVQKSQLLLACSLANDLKLKLHQTVKTVKRSWKERTE
jgi:hypothetical protein